MRVCIGRGATTYSSLLYSICIYIFCFCGLLWLWFNCAYSRTFQIKNKIKVFGSAFVRCLLHNFLTNRFTIGHRCVRICVCVSDSIRLNLSVQGAKQLFRLLNNFLIEILELREFSVFLIFEIRCPKFDVRNALLEMRCSKCGVWNSMFEI